MSLKKQLKRRNNYPNLNFQTLNILTDCSETKFDASVLSNLIWYVLHEPDVLSKNLISSLNLSKTKIVSYSFKIHYSELGRVMPQTR